MAVAEIVFVDHGREEVSRCATDFAHGDADVGEGVTAELRERLGVAERDDADVAGPTEVGGVAGVGDGGEGGGAREDCGGSLEGALYLGNVVGVAIEPGDALLIDGHPEVGEGAIQSLIAPAHQGPRLSKDYGDPLMARCFEEREGHFVRGI